MQIEQVECHYFTAYKVSHMYHHRIWSANISLKTNVLVVILDQGISANIQVHTNLFTYLLMHGVINIIDNTTIGQECIT